MTQAIKMKDFGKKPKGEYKNPQATWDQVTVNQQDTKDWEARYYVGGYCCSNCGLQWEIGLLRGYRMPHVLLCPNCETLQEPKIQSSQNGIYPIVEHEYHGTQY